MPFGNKKNWGALRWGVPSRLRWSDNSGPVVKITSPEDGLYINTTPISVSWTVDGVSQVDQLSENLSEGSNIVYREYTDAAGVTGSDSVEVVLDTVDPVVVIVSPETGSLISTNPVAVSWTVDGVAQTTQLTESLSEGSNDITREYTDRAGNYGSDTVSVTLDTIAPVVEIVSPEDGVYTNETPATIVWTIDGVTQGSLTSEDLDEGSNVVYRESTDAAGNTGSDTITINLDTISPTVVIVTPETGSLVSTTPLAVTWTVDGVPQTEQLTEILVEGANLITRQATDLAGNIGIDVVSVTLDTIAPTVVIISPTDGSTVTETPVAVVWTVDSVTQGSLTTEDLTEGSNEIVRQASDAAGNIGSDSVTITYSPPAGGDAHTDDASLIAWWDTNDETRATQSSGVVSALLDQTDTYTLSQANPTDQPDWNTTFNGNRIYTYDGLGWMSTTIDWGSGGNICIMGLFYSSSVDNFEDAFCSTSGSNTWQFSARDSASFLGRMYCGGPANSFSLTGGPWDVVPVIVEIVWDWTSGTGNVYMDGVKRTSDETYYGQITGSETFNLMTNSNQNRDMAGKHGDVVVFTDISSSNRDFHRGLLQTKYGL